MSNFKLIDDISSTRKQKIFYEYRDDSMLPFDESKIGRAILVKTEEEWAIYFMKGVIDLDEFIADLSETDLFDEVDKYDIVRSASIRFTEDYV
jgi:hypothetical protein